MGFQDHLGSHTRPVVLHYYTKNLNHRKKQIAFECIYFNIITQQVFFFLFLIKIVFHE